jgi:hypothetical protein
MLFLFPEMKGRRPRKEEKSGSILFAGHVRTGNRRVEQSYARSTLNTKISRIVMQMLETKEVFQGRYLKLKFQNTSKAWLKVLSHLPYDTDGVDIHCPEFTSQTLLSPISYIARL